MDEAAARPLEDLLDELVFNIHALFADAPAEEAAAPEAEVADDRAE